MKIVVAGGTGFLGEPLVRRLVARGDDVTVLTRNPAKVEAGQGLQWDGRTQGAWSADAASADVVINLAGENIAEGRWTDQRKQRLIDSRLDATHALVEAMRREPSRKRTMINASATDSTEIAETRSSTRLHRAAPDFSRTSSIDGKPRHAKRSRSRVS